MNRRTFLAAIAAIPAAAIAGLRRPLDWIPIKPIEYSAQRFWRREEIARIFRVPVHLLGDDGSSTFGHFEGTEEEIDELRKRQIEILKRKYGSGQDENNQAPKG